MRNDSARDLSRPLAAISRGRSHVLAKTRLHVSSDHTAAPDSKHR